MITSSNMGLKIWNLLTDLFDHSQLADNLTAIDQHDHSGGKGVPIGTPGIASGVITTVKVANNAITLPLMAAGVARMTHTYVATFPFTAADGQFVDVAATGTVTLPAASTANRTISVINNVPGPAPFTVATTGSDRIYAAGAWGVTSIPFGALGTGGTFQSDGGTSWFLCVGQQDTGWLPLTMGPNYHVETNFVPQFRLKGSRTELRGACDRNSGNVTSGDIIATIPLAAARPTRAPGANTLTMPTISGGATVPLEILDTGDIEAFGNGSAYAALDGLSFFVD